MTFPTALTNAVDGVTEIIAAHLNNLEAKVGIDNSAVITSLDYLLRNPASINPGHLHTASQVGLGNVTNNAQVILQGSTPGTAQTGHINVSGTVIAGGFSGPLTGNVTGNVTGSSGSCTGNAASATYSAASTITDDTSTNATMYPLWVTANTGNLPTKVTSSKLTYNPSTGTLTTTQLSVPPGSLTAPAMLFTGTYMANTGFNAGGGTYKAIDIVSGGSLICRFADVAGVVSTVFTGRAPIGFSGSGNHTSDTSPDLYLSRSAAASLQLGILHATTPTGQTIKAHNVTTGTGASLTLAGGTGSVANGDVLLNPTSGNVGIKTSSFGTSAVGVLGMGSATAPTTAPADIVQLWCADVNGAAGYAGLHKRTETTNLVEVVPGVVIKTNTGDSANPYEGLMQINTFDNTFKVYADAGWRQLATW